MTEVEFRRARGRKLMRWELLHRLAAEMVAQHRAPTEAREEFKKQWVEPTDEQVDAWLASKG